MTTVRLLQHYEEDLMYMTPGHRGEWDGIRFTHEALEQPDYVVILNQPAEPVQLRCHPSRVWCVAQEPPTPFHAHFHAGPDGVSRVYTTDETRRARQHRPTYSPLNWQAGKDYDELSQLAPPDKTRDLSWVTSDLTWLPGHRRRMRFLEQIRDRVPLDLYGRGFKPIENKWNALAPYRYSIAFENFENNLYWTEKLVDCFLAYCTPFYFGCTRLERFFPEGSFIRIDPDDPHVVERIKEITAGDHHEQHADALAEARDLCLNHYNLFAFLSREMHAHRRFFWQRPQPMTLTPRELTAAEHARALAWNAEDRNLSRKDPA